MDIKWLEDFLSLAETGSFSRSAANSHVTQPAFSRRIRALESWLGAELIDRSVYPTQLTPAGEMFREHAASILQNIMESRAMLRGQRPLPADTVQFAVPHTLSLTFFPKWLSEVESGFGQVSSKLLAANVHDAVMALVEGNCDLLLCYHHAHQPVRLDPERYPMLHLGVEAMLPYARADKSGEPVFRLPGSAAHPVLFLSYSPNAYLGRMVDMILRAAPEPCHLVRRYETDMAEALKVMALEGHGVAWLPDSAVVREFETKKLALAVAPERAEQWRGEMEVRLYRDRDRRRPIVDRLWKALEAGQRRRSDAKKA
jgi:DNA-binding transcriptional LysR family regulator